jgi:class 3 adenylate cyclase/tetratricopeptide (TPR) repeat protein
VRRCHRCGHESPDEARFCHNCAAPLGSGPAATETRQTVTILFLDIVESTRLGKKLEPEFLRSVMARFFDTVREPIERHGGTLEKFIGDAVMAVFGIPVVHEDDAFRACRAALETRERLDALNLELARDYDVTVSIRTGVNTGEVVAADQSSMETLVTGDAVVVAARLEQGAGPGEILIGQATHELLAGRISAEPVDPVSTKGTGEPISGYRLLSIHRGGELRTPRLISPLVGRKAELALIHEALDRSTADRRCVLATVLGQPGVGKSRLVHEFISSITGSAVVLRGRCLPYGDGITFWPLAEVVRQSSGIAEDMSPQEARTQIERVLPDDDARDMIRDRVAAMIGLSEGSGRLQEGFWAVRRFLEALGARGPLVVVVEDIHWAEPTFLDLIEYLEGRVDAFALLIICLARPELLRERAGWATGATQPVTITLDPLRAEESHLLVENLLGATSISEEVSFAVTNAAEGNPLFIEEMLAMLVDERQVHQDEGGPETEEVAVLPIPSSVQGVLAARIGRLSPEQRSILQRASVAGRVFWWGAVASLSPAHEQEVVGSHLQALVRDGLIVPEESTFGGEDAFKFRHILIREASYASIPRTLRSTLHERFADWMVRAVGDRVEGHEEILGYHLEQACAQRFPSTGSSDRALAIRASKLLSSAGRRAFDRDDIKAALTLSRRASRLCPADGPERFAIQQLLADSLRLSARPREADEILAQLEQDAAAAGDRGAEWFAKIVRAQLLGSTTNVPSEDLTATIDQALEVFNELGHDRGSSVAWNLLAWLRINAGQVGLAIEAIQKSAMHDRAAGDAAQEAWKSIGLVSFAALGDTPVDDALELCRSALDHVKGQPGHESTLRITQGRLESMRGDIGAARESIGRARSILKELGVNHALAAMTDGAADVERYAGNLVGEERELRSGYEAFGEMGAEGYQATWAALLAQNLAEQGRYDEAFELTMESEAMAAPDDLSAQVPWRGVRARVLAHRGEGEGAERLAREGVSIADGTDVLNMRGDAHRSLAKVLLALGRSAEAAEEFDAAKDLYELKGNVVAAGWARSSAEHLSSDGR